MKAHWFVAKYMEDVRRREPTNVGVVLVHGDRRLCRFLGQRQDGKLDGRRIRWAGSLDNYKAWVAYWEHVVSSKEPEALTDSLTTRRADDSYLMEVGGERVVGSNDRSAEDLLDYLYEILVEPTFERTALSVSKISESLFHRLGVHEKVARNVRLEIPENENEDEADLIHFDYRFDNGQVNLMQGVSLAVPDERSWDGVHAATWSFVKAAKHKIDVQKGQQLIALVKTREPDAEQRRQMALLTAHAKVVDLVDENVAAEHLRGLLHV